ncbi:MAG: hypothetical protein JO256_05595 [Alphaproteobacteria bacterium]|nr:hypothetical protein [Alphaproteobacteria bacterium]
MAISRLRFECNEHAVIGGLPHSYFDEIGLQADWYTGDCVFEAPGEHKVTDLEWCEARIEKLQDGGIITQARTPTANGIIDKRMHFRSDSPCIDFDITFEWQKWEPGSLRLGHFTLLPDAFHLDRLRVATNNGGSREVFSLPGHTIDHGAPVSFLVSSSFGLGMTEGWLEIGDDKTKLRIEVDRGCAPMLGMLIHRPAKRYADSTSLFCQVQLSAFELDDTRRPTPYQGGFRRFCFRVLAI